MEITTKAVTEEFYCKATGDQAAPVIYNCQLTINGLKTLEQRRESLLWKSKKKQGQSVKGSWNGLVYYF